MKLEARFRCIRCKKFAENSNHVIDSDTDFKEIARSGNLVHLDLEERVYHLCDDGAIAPTCFLGLLPVNEERRAVTEVTVVESSRPATAEAEDAYLLGAFRGALERISSTLGMMGSPDLINDVPREVERVLGRVLSNLQQNQIMTTIEPPRPTTGKAENAFPGTLEKQCGPMAGLRPRRRSTSDSE